MHTALLATVAWAMFALAIPGSLDLFSDSLVTRDEPDSSLDCARLSVTCSKVFLNAELTHNDLAEYCADTSTHLDDFTFDSHQDRSNCVNGAPVVDQGDPTCTVAAQYSWGKRFEASFTIRRWRKACNDPITGATGRKTAMLKEVCGIVKGDYSATGTASVEDNNVHCGER